MDTNVIVAIVSGAFTFAGVVLTIIATTNKILNSLQSQNEVQNVKIQNLTDEVKKHNDFATRIPIIETNLNNTINRVDKIEQHIGN